MGQISVEIRRPPGSVPRGNQQVQDQIEHFAGCVYVSDPHKVLMPDGRLLAPERFNATMGGHEFAMQMDGAKPTKKAFEAFTESRARRFPKVARTVFRPDRMFGEVIGDAVNFYKPANVASVPGDVTLFLAHLALLLPLASDRETLLQYMACVVQRPGYKVKWAPVVQGTPGNGKTFLVDCLREAIGREFVHTAKSEELGEKFNDFLENNLLVVVEEIDTRDRRDVMNILTPLITNLDLEVRSMNVAKRKGLSYANFFFCCNPRDAIVKGRDDRRNAILYTAQQSANDLSRDGMGGEYFSTLYDWAQGGGFANVTHYLMSYPIGNMPTRAPLTSSTEAAIVESLGAAESAIADAVEEGRQGFRGGWVSSWAATRAITEATGRVPVARTIGSAMRNLGYRETKRSSRIIMQEGGKQPMLYAKDDRPNRAEDYLVAQGYSIT